MKVRVVIDVEMCRVQMKCSRFPCKHEIIQIGAVMMDESYKIKGKFSTYVKPRFGKIDHFISRFTGISERTIKTAPDIEVALELMLDWIENNEPAFYSWSDTDYNQIRNEIMLKCHDRAKWDILLDPSKWTDYQIILGARLETSRLLKLSEALEMAELDIEGRLHDGLDDAWNTARMIAKLETHKDYRMVLERYRENEKKYEPLTASLSGLLQGITIEVG